MTITPEKIKELRELIASHGKSTWAYYLNFSDAMPALLDAAEENVKLNKLVDDIALEVGRYYEYDGPFVRAPDKDIMEAIRDGERARIGLRNVPVTQESVDAMREAQRKFIQDSIVGCPSCQGTGTGYTDMHGKSDPCGACLGFRKISEEKTE